MKKNIIVHILVLASMYLFGQSNTNAGYGAPNAGSYNSFCGYYSAGQGSPELSTQNSFFGSYSGATLTSGKGNCAFGYNSGNLLSTGIYNTFAGFESGKSITTGSYNVMLGSSAGGLAKFDIQNAIFIGNKAGYSATNSSNVGIGTNSCQFIGGMYNIGIGENSLNSIAGSTASYNIALGYFSGNAIISGSNNFFGGNSAGKLTTTGNKNIFIGLNAGYLNSCGSNNIALGESAGYGITGSSDNVCIGSFTGSVAGVGNSNTFVGPHAGERATGSNNSFFGLYAGSFSKGNNNVAVGPNSFVGSSSGTSTGNNNSAVGLGSGGNITTGSNNVVFGCFSGYGTTTGSNNVYVGNQSGMINNGNNNVFIGNNTASTETALSNTFALSNSSTSYLMYGNFSTNQVAIGTKTLASGYALTILGGLLVKTSETATNPALSVNANGKVCMGTATVYNNGTEDYLLSVNGKVACTELRVVAPWADFVFDHNYKLRTLYEVESFIEQNNRLPDIPSATEVERDGLSVGDMQAKMMQKIEELTLYMIQMQKETDAMNTEVQALKSKVE